MTNQQQALDAIQEAFRRISLSFPYLVGLIQKISLQLDHRVSSIGIFASGRLAVNPDFVAKLKPAELVFVLTHELYHLMLRTHQRAEGTDSHEFNIAHDYIINDMLREELLVAEIPAGGMDRRGARFLSAEKIIEDLRRGAPLSSPSWSQAGQGGSGRQPSQPAGPPGDVLSDRLERDWFGESPRQQQAQAHAIAEQSANALAMQALMDSMSGKNRGTGTDGQDNSVAALRGMYRPAWEMALQRWLETMAPSDRSYARPSRRGADQCDVVLPGRKREGWMLNVILDTSGSMAEEIPHALGAIADFCESLGVEQIRLVQCDTQVEEDEILAPVDLARWQVKGFGGSDLTEAMHRLAEDGSVQAAVVLTDGDIEYPREPVPYSVLWVLPPRVFTGRFEPGYGCVLSMK